MFLTIDTLLPGLHLTDGPFLLLPKLLRVDVARPWELNWISSAKTIGLLLPCCFSCAPCGAALSFKSPAMSAICLTWVGGLEWAAVHGTGQKSVWVAKSKPRWERFFIESCGHGLIIQSSHGNVKGGDALHWRDRCLPTISTSTFGLLLLLERWAFSHKEVGGLQEKRPRQAAKELFSAMLLQITSEHIKFHLELVDSWQCRWPRPQPCEHAVVELEIRDGKLILTALHAVAIRRAKLAKTVAVATQP